MLHNSRIRIYTVEDDPSYALELEMMIENLGFELAGHSTSVNEAITGINKSKPDIILSDIYLGEGGEGFQLAREFPSIPIIFLTAFSDENNYRKAKELSSKAFLVKPFDKLTLMNAIENALGMGKTASPEHTFSNRSVFIKHKNQLVRLFYDDIISIHSEGNYCTIQTKDKKFVLRISLKKIKEQLDDPQLVQVHRAFLVREKKIVNIDLSKSVLTTEIGEIPIGRNYKKDLISRLPKI